MLVEGLALTEKMTGTNMQKDRADKRSEGFADQVFEPTAVLQWPCGHTMTLRLIVLHFQQCLSLAQGQKPWSLKKKWLKGRMEQGKNLLKQTS